MPRGRHRHSPPLHRLLPPSAIAGVSVVCALGPWVFSETAVLRVLAGAAAATALAGAFVMRRWDIHAGKQVADLTRARAGDEWRFEERVAELETDLEESRELRGKLEQRLRAKRAELAGLRNEHAALLRRYATAETERASALEGRRLLEIESGAPALEPAGRTAPSLPSRAASPALPPARSAEPDTADGEETEKAYDVFSAEGAKLYGQALRALAAFERDAAGGAERAQTATVSAATETATATESASEPGSASEAVGEDEAGAKGDGAEGDIAGRDEVRAETAPEAEAEAVPEGEDAPAAEDVSGAESFGSAEGIEGVQDLPGGETAAQDRPLTADGHATAAEPAAPKTTGPPKTTGTPKTAEAAETAEAPGAPGSPELPVASAASETPVGRTSAGHFTVPTAVAVVPASPVRRPLTEGGFDFFGTQKATPKAALDAVQNEDLADVVGQEALAVHKAEAEAEFKPADDSARGVGQVIDLTAHDETEVIDVQGLRSAAS
ncbi:hypothetical protein ME763_15675 [Streptomyces murinus]|uniref:hypothetical protein n=1 Tax=Streptomyces murinus TaxID=33900 RepID=UPI0015521F7C|nr:hypothetical protein [Streptomyces murinus]WDO06987.1 hypothetical protein ME763_15675 [Streptomyces murinus]